MDGGHCGYTHGEVVEAAIKMLESPGDICEAAVDYMIQQGKVIQLVRDNDDVLIYLAALDRAEESLSLTLADLLDAVHPCPEIDIEKAIQWIGQKVGLQLAAQQQEAIRIAVQSKVMIITGGPGVGKTTLVNAIVKIIRAKKLKVVLASPTGRAAKRMMETTELSAKTIHRLKPNS